MEKLGLRNSWKVWSIVVLLMLAYSCSKDEDVIIVDPPEEETPATLVETSKDFIYNTFKDYYLWLEEVPEVDPNSYQTNDDLMDALRYDQIDRWSFVTSLDEYRALFEQGETKGYGVGMALLPDDRLMVRFTYAKAPMGLAGVERGWEFYKINDVAIPKISNLGAAFDTDAEVKFTFITNTKDTVDRLMTRVDYQINTVLHQSVIETEGKRVGYLVFESFLDPSVTELDIAFNYFQQENIDDLVVDLRYNGGGSLNVAFQLAALVGGSSVDNKIVASIINNSNHSDDDINYGVQPEENAVNLPRLFFITTEGSASASEMVINSMFPYKEVILIGEKTHGKPVGMQVFESEKYQLALAPITFQLVNAYGNGHYFDGIPVDYEVTDDIFHNWGDPEEACLKQALGIITGSGDVLALKSQQIKSKAFPLKRGLQEITGAY